MKINQVLSYIFLTITITTTYALTENHINDESIKQYEHQLKKRSATVLIEPSDVRQYTHGTVVFNKPKRYAKQRRKPNSWKMQATAKVPKKIRRYPKPPAYGSSRKSRTPKPIYRPKPKPWATKPNKNKNAYKAPVKSTLFKYRDPLPTYAEPPSSNHYTASSTFGEPPLHTPTSSINTMHLIENQFTKGQEFQPPPFHPTDVYRNKIRDTHKYPMEDFNYPQYQYDVPEEISASSINQHRFNPFDDEEVAFGQEFKKPKDHFEENYMDNTAEFSRHHPVYANPHPSANAILHPSANAIPHPSTNAIPHPSANAIPHPSANAILDNLENKPHTVDPEDSFKQVDAVTSQYKSKVYNKPNTYSSRHQHKMVNKFKTVRMNSHLLGSDDEPDQLLVGGKYAEPPARLVPKQIENSHSFKQHNMEPPIYRGYEGPAFTVIDDDDGDFRIQSASMSPYVNYKNSNMAFSPQNLNDAFGIVDM